jgi:hypothetical protein
LGGEGPQVVAGAVVALQKPELVTWFQVRAPSVV